MWPGRFSGGDATATEILVRIFGGREKAPDIRVNDWLERGKPLRRANQDDQLLCVGKFSGTQKVGLKEVDRTVVSITIDHPYRPRPFSIPKQCKAFLWTI
jgi:hypothetical protein